MGRQRRKKGISYIKIGSFSEGRLEEYSSVKMNIFPWRRQEIFRDKRPVIFKKWTWLFFFTVANWPKPFYPLSKCQLSFDKYSWPLEFRGGGNFISFLHIFFLSGRYQRRQILTNVQIFNSMSAQNGLMTYSAALTSTSLCLRYFHRNFAWRLDSEVDS